MAYMFLHELSRRLSATAINDKTDDRSYTSEGVEEKYIECDMKNRPA
jgi:hypothetical protein